MNANASGRRRLASCVSTFAWSPDGQRIAFTGYNGKHLDGIRLVSADGRFERRLTRGADDEVTWSPDGQRIAFVRGWTTLGAHEILTMNANGTRARALARGDTPKWSHDGRTIAYLADSGSGPIYRIAPNGGRPHLFVRAHAGDVTEFAWSPREPQIAYVAIDQGAGDLSSICFRGVGGRISRCPAWLTEDNLISDLAWSPDGRSLVFDDEALGSMVLANTSARPRRVLPADGSNPSWSPDGRKIAFDRAGFGPTEVVNVNGTGLRQLVADGSYPSWQPGR